MGFLFLRISLRIHHTAGGYIHSYRLASPVGGNRNTLSGIWLTPVTAMRLMNGATVFPACQQSVPRTPSPFCVRSVRSALDMGRGRYKKLFPLKASDDYLWSDIISYRRQLCFRAHWQG